MENISSGVIEEILIKVLWTNMHIGWKETSNFMAWNNWGNLSWESLKGKGETALRLSEKRRKSTRPPPSPRKSHCGFHWLNLTERFWLKSFLCTWGLNSKAKYCCPPAPRALRLWLQKLWIQRWAGQIWNPQRVFCYSTWDYFLQKKVPWSFLVAQTWESCPDSSLDRQMGAAHRIDSTILI